MKSRVILVRYGEIFLKGNNSFIFITALSNNIKNALKEFNCEVETQRSRYVIKDYKIEDEDEIVEIIKKIYGIYSFSLADEIDTNDLFDYFNNDYVLETDTFRVSVNRADKTYPINSTELSAKLGGVLLKRFKKKVDLHTPQTIVSVDMRQNGKSYVFDKIIKASGGMPVGTSGKVLALMSGGIDSPVASVKMAQRGLQVEAVHFFSYPYTSVEAKEKVIELCKIVKPYTMMTKIYMVPFTRIQEEIHKNCDNNFMITIMRRFMARIASIIARKNDMSALVTGESLGQVASQTVESLISTTRATDMLFLRPLIAMDKEEIIDIAKKINTFETSILPYEDCCTVFLPKRPVIKPKLAKVLEEEDKMKDIYDKLIQEAVDNTEIIEI